MAYIPGLEAVQRALRGDIDDSADERLTSCADDRGRISPQHVADRYRMTRSQAKAMLEAAASRGLLDALPTGWYQVASGAR